MGFEFGMVDALDPKLTVACFVGVVAFIVFFDYVSGILEYFVEKRHLYHRMIKVIYKELMLMGLVSLAVDMYVAGMGDRADKVEGFLSAVDFAHIVLFYVTIFFVLHAISLIKLSLSIESTYREYFAEKTTDLRQKVQTALDHPVSRFFFFQKYLPFSHTRDLVEFSLIHSIFYSTYALPPEFNFSAYLSGSFARFSLKTIKRSLSTWLVLLVLVIINYARLMAGYGCVVSEQEDDEGRRRILRISNAECRGETVQLFLFCGGLVVLYTFLVVIVSRYYRIRMLRFAGPSEPEETIEFLDFKVEVEEHARQHEHWFRYDLDVLRQEVDEELNAQEHNEEEQEFRWIANWLVAAMRSCREAYGQLRLTVRIWCTQLLCPERLKGRQKHKLGTETSVLHERHTESAGSAPSLVRDSIIANHTNTASDKAHDNSRDVEMARDSNNYGMDKSLIRQTSGASANQFDAPSPPISSPSTAATANATAAGHKKDGLRHRLKVQRAFSEKLKTVVVNTVNCPTSSDTTSTTIGSRNGTGVVKADDDEDDDDFDADEEGDSFHPFSDDIDLSYQEATSNFATANASKLVKRESKKTISAHDDIATINGPPPRQLLKRVASMLVEEQVSYSYTSVLNQFRRFQASRLRQREGEAKKDEATNASSTASPTNKSMYNVLHNTTHLLSPLRHVLSFRAHNNSSHGSLNGASTANAIHVSQEAAELARAMEQCAQDQTQAGQRFVAHNRDELNALRNAAGKEFHHIFLGHRPEWYFLAVELCLMVNCLYSSLWLTNFISLAAESEYRHSSLEVLLQFVMLLPPIIATYSMSYITSTCSVLSAVTELDIEVVQEVLVDMAEAEGVVAELRSKILSMADAADYGDETQRQQFIAQLFAEIDSDGSGTLDSDEFRQLLRSVHLTYSDYRYNLLFASVDTSGNGLVSQEELQDFIFPPKLQGSSLQTNGMINDTHCRNHVVSFQPKLGDDQV